MPGLISRIMSKSIFLVQVHLHVLCFKKLRRTMKTVEKAHRVVNQEKICGCYSQKEEERLKDEEEMTCPMTINPQLGDT